MNQTFKVTRKQVASIVDLTFPTYRGRKFRVEAAERVTFHDTNWGGGTKNTYAVVMRDGMEANFFNAPAPWVNALEGKTVEIPSGLIVVEHCIFCGQDLGLRFYVRPDELPGLLPERTN